MAIRLDHVVQRLIVGVFTLLAGTRSAMADIVLAQDAAARAVVVVAADATPPEQHAAAELGKFLGEVTGAKFVTLTVGTDGKLTDGKLTDGVRLLVGPGAARLGDPGFSTDGLGQEGFILRTIERPGGGDLILAGGRPRGTLYAVYTFLEDQVGCHWWTSKVSSIPKKPTLAIGKLDVRFVPRFEYRESFWFDAFDGDWAARNRCNGHAERLDERRGGKHIYEGFVHTFYGLIPPEKYFKDHPEWFAEIDGKRKWEHAQLCLTNEAMRAEVVKNLEARLRANPQATIASVSQNDWHGNCRCAACAAVDQEEGSPAGSLLRFVNAVAAEIEGAFPHVAIDTLAYQYTRKPPAKTRPRANVIVRLCSIECSFSKPLSDERNRAFGDDLRGWSQICARLYIWDYTTNFAHYILPHPNLRVLGPNIRFFAEHGVKGVFEQGAYQSHGAEMAELRAWVLAQLLWDPGRDPQKLVDMFLDGYYGPAAEPLRAYLKLTHDAVNASGDKLGCYSPPDAKFLSLANLSAAVRLWENAVAAATVAEKQPAWAAQGAAPGLLLRVQTAALPTMYTLLVRWDALRQEAKANDVPWPVADSPARVYELFMDTARAAQVTMISEGQALAGMAQRVPPAATQPATQPAK
ncbi:MAG: DUF4838 domain-containing protein [Planctomycetota bacterium]